MTLVDRTLKAVNCFAVVRDMSHHNPQQTDIDEQQQDALQLVVIRDDLSQDGDSCLQHPELNAGPADTVSQSCCPQS